MVLISSGICKLYTDRTEGNTEDSLAIQLCNRLLYKVVFLKRQRKKGNFNRIGKEKLFRPTTPLCLPHNTHHSENGRKVNATRHLTFRLSNVHCNVNLFQERPRMKEATVWWRSHIESSACCYHANNTASVAKPFMLCHNEVTCHLKGF